MTYYKLKTTMTSKPAGNSGDGFNTFHQETLDFKTVEEVKNYLAERYGNCKTQKIHRDAEDGQAELVGKIYCFKNKEFENGEYHNYFQQDWTEVCLVTEKNVLIN